MEHGIRTLVPYIQSPEAGPPMDVDVSKIDFLKRELLKQNRKLFQRSKDLNIFFNLHCYAEHGESFPFCTKCFDSIPRSRPPKCGPVYDLLSDVP